MAICGYIDGEFLHFPLPVLPVCFAAGNRQRPLKPLPPAKALPVPCIGTVVKDWGISGKNIDIWEIM